MGYPAPDFGTLVLEHDAARTCVYDAKPSPYLPERASRTATARRLREVLDRSVRTGKEEALVAVISPADDVGRCTVLAAHFDDLGVTVRFADMVTLDDEAITHTCSHENASSFRSG